MRGTIYSLRHGGAIRDRSMAARSLAAVQLRCGWRVFKSVTRYEKRGGLGLELQKLGEARERQLRRLVGGIELAFAKCFAAR